MSGAPERERERLQDTRGSVTRNVVIESEQGPVSVFITAGLYEDGRLAEVFVQMGQVGSTMRGMLDSWAIMISFALQYGIALDVLVRRFEDTVFPPAGATNNPAIPTCSSVVDYVMGWLAREFGEGETK